MPKRAIALGGGGPVAGLHIGVLDYLKTQNIDFDVWALSCIGAWVGIVYNTRERDAAKETYKFFDEYVFRDDEGYKVFPVNRVFGPDWQENFAAMARFVADPIHWQMWPSSDQIKKARLEALFALWPKAAQGDFGDLNEWFLNALAVNPAARFWTSLMFLSGYNGLSKIYYPGSTFLNSIDFKGLKDKKPYIYHNAWDLTEQKLKLFYNKPPPGKGKDEREYPPITAASLCACSALPFVESTVRFGEPEHNFCEGARFRFGSLGQWRRGGPH
jgi:predicted acylesterase/phospholipase RssA